MPSIHAIQHHIANIMQDYDIPAYPVTIIAVSKTQPLAKIRPLLDAGHRVFGENRLQEAVEKWSVLRTEYEGIQLHYIGHLQSNKVQTVCDFFDAIHTIDRESLVLELVKYREKNYHLPKLFCQINIGSEPQKSGVMPDDLEHFLSFCHDHNIHFEGLMCLPPAHDLPIYHFGIMAQLNKKYGFKNTSMGMSADYPQAIMCHSNHIRLGSILFGERDHA